MLALPLTAALVTQHPAFDAQARVTEAITAVRPSALGAGRVDWPALESDLRRQAETATDTADMLPIYDQLLLALGDGHSFVQADPELARVYRERHGRAYDADRPKPAAMTSAFRGRQEIEGRDIPLASGRSVRVVVTPQIFGGGAGARAASARLFSAVTETPDTCGYVVDLRGNQGGNVWPMLVGLSPLLGDGPQGRERDRSGRVSTYARLTEGAAIVLEGEYKDMAMTRAENWRPMPDLVDLPVAVLIDDAVASSGEGVAVAFKGRSLTRYFGQKTYGVATSNSGFMMADGVNLVVTLAEMVDRDGRTYPDGVSPDEVVAHGPGRADDPEDAVVEAARDWLATQATCRAA
jgi:hypothetical protein